MDINDELLEHSGVMGMHWGHHKASGWTPKDHTKAKEHVAKAGKRLASAAATLGARKLGVAKKPSTRTRITKDGIKVTTNPTHTRTRINLDGSKSVIKIKDAITKATTKKPVLPDSKEHTQTKTLRKLKMNQMTNVQLRDINTRLQLERSYKDLNKKTISPGRKKVQDILFKIGKTQGPKFVGAMAEKQGYPNVAKYAKVMNMIMN